MVAGICSLVERGSAAAARDFAWTPVCTRGIPDQIGDWEVRLLGTIPHWYSAAPWALV
jgi:hypothetical protein